MDGKSKGKTLGKRFSMRQLRSLMNIQVVQYGGHQGGSRDTVIELSKRDLIRKLRIRSKQINEQLRYLTGS